MYKQYHELCDDLGYQFKNQDLLILALTHRSFEAPNNERLEFLGDAILGLIVARLLYHKFPESPEGQLTKMRSYLVKGHTLSQVARDLKLGRFLKLGVGELKSGGVERDSILEDTCEAVIGAIYLDSDLKTTQAVVLKWFEDRIEALAETDLSPQDAKSKLQECLQGEGHDLPTYELLRTEGKDHEQTFYVSCAVPAYDLLCEGVGRSRKSAEQEAAAACIEGLQNLTAPPLAN